MHIVIIIIHRHFFDGMSMLVSFRPGEDDGSVVVHMKKRLLRSEALRRATAHGRPITTEYGTPGAPDPDGGVIARVIASLVPGEMTDNCACSVYQIGGWVLAGRMKLLQ